MQNRHANQAAQLKSIFEQEHPYLIIPLRMTLSVTPCLLRHPRLIAPSPGSAAKANKSASQP
jgi:hypothetical protein